MSCDLLEDDRERNIEGGFMYCGNNAEVTGIGTWNMSSSCVLRNMRSSLIHTQM